MLQALEYAKWLCLAFVLFTVILLFAIVGAVLILSLLLGAMILLIYGVISQPEEKTEKRRKRSGRIPLRGIPTKKPSIS